MARGRMLSKSFSTSRKRGALLSRGGALAEYAEALYVKLVAHADDFGREEGDAFTVKHRVDPLSTRDEDDVARALGLLHEVGLIQWFRDANVAVIAIVDFDTHQVGLHKRTGSKFPEPPDTSGMFPHKVPVQEKGTELKGTELKGTEKNAGALRAVPLPLPVEKSNGGPNVPMLAAMVLRDILPLHLSDPNDVVEAAKSRAASLHLAYDGRSIANAIASARAQAGKGVEV